MKKKVSRILAFILSIELIGISVIIADTKINKLAPTIAKTSTVEFQEKNTNNQIDNQINLNPVAKIEDIYYDETSNKFKIPTNSRETIGVMSHLKNLNGNVNVNINVKVGEYDESMSRKVIASMTDINTGDIDYEKVKEWCNTITSRYNTISSIRKIKSWNGETVIVQPGDYGSQCDFGNFTDDIYNALLTSTSKNLQYKIDTTNTYNNQLDIGNTYIECDLTNQKIHFYRDGKCILSTDCVTGKKSTPTPEGVYSIKCNAGRTRLIGPTWDCYVNNWAAFYDGCGLHDASWQSSFGLDRWESGYGSHGCINLPVKVASKLPSIISVGEPIIVYKR